MGDFKLSASLVGHDDDVRAVAFPLHNAVISASRDGTVRLWKGASSNPPSFDATITSHGSAFVNAVTYMPPSTEYPEGLVVSGGKDTIIEVRQPSRGPEENAERLLLGHGNNICALDVESSGKYIVSGSWDKTARVWSVGKWETESVLDGHDGSVWAVLAYDAKTIITGCADKQIRIFDISGKLMSTIRGSADVVRALCRLPNGHPSGADFASAGNDSIIRLWTLNGNQVGELYGHENFIYSIAALPSGELVSSGEDRTVRIWRGSECIQTITHPAISVWGVAVCIENGDIVSGASDRIVRIFSRSRDRIADSETIRQFDESVKASAIPQQQLPDINKEKLPGPEFLQQKSGTKEGQVVMIREPNGSVTAHQWSASQNQWINVGTVVDAVGSSGKKVDFNGKDYDYVFDVDIEDGKPPLKLPYNLSQNPYEVATKFIEDNELPISYLDQVANFITTNTQGATIGSSQSQGPTAAGSDPWGTESRYRPGDAQQQSYTPSSIPTASKILPQKTYLSILVARYDAMQKKIKELNQTLISTGHKDLALNPTDLSALQSLKKDLETPEATKKATHSVPGALDLAVKLCTTWPYADRLPGLDLLRLLAVAPATATYTHPRGNNIIDVLESSVLGSQPPAENHLMMAIRAFANLFESPEGRALAAKEFDKITSLTSSALADGKTGNRNLVVAATTLYINYAVLLTSDEQKDNDEKAFEQSLALVDGLVKTLQHQSDAEGVYRALVAVGTLLHVGEEVVTAAREVYGLAGVVKGVVAKTKDPRVRNVVGEIGGLLK